MADVKVVLTPDPLFLQGSGADPTSYDASSDRKFMQDAISPGVRDAGDFAFSVVSGMTGQVAAGIAYILGQNVADQGMYRQYRASTTNITAPAAHATLPRLDQLILRVLDWTHDNNGGGLFEGRLEWIEGVATSGATLANRTGAKDLTALSENSKSVLLLGDYLMTAAASALTISGTTWADKRTRAFVGGGKALGGSRIPGEIMAWPSNTLPDPVKWGTWLLCNGTSYLRSDYPDLFTNLGGASSPWGLPDGTHFNVPDFVGRTLYGRNALLAEIDNIADNEGQAVASRGPKHRHTVTDPGHKHPFPIWPAAASGGGPTGTSNSPPSYDNTIMGSAFTGITVGPAGSPLDTGGFGAINWLIKA